MLMGAQVYGQNCSLILINNIYKTKTVFVVVIASPTLKQFRNSMRSDKTRVLVITSSDKLMQYYFRKKD